MQTAKTQQQKERTSFETLPVTFISQRGAFLINPQHCGVGEAQTCIAVIYSYFKCILKMDILNVFVYCIFVHCGLKCIVEFKIYSCLVYILFHHPELQYKLTHGLLCLFVCVRLSGTLSVVFFTFWWIFICNLMY